MKIKATAMAATLGATGAVTFDQGLQSASAAAPVPTSFSYYMKDQTGGTAFAKGCEVGDLAKNAPGTQQLTVVLGFGGPRFVSGTVGASNWDKPDYSSADIASIAENFIGGFIYCAATDTTSRVHVGVATSNDSNVNTTAAHGSGWAALVNTVNSYVQSSAWGARATIYGSSDIEPSFNASVANSKAWVTAHVAGTSRAFMPNNSMDGCPTSGTYSASTGCNAPSSGAPAWTVEDLWQVSSGGAMAPVPQIYNGAQAQQWYRMSVYSKSAKGYKTFFKNTMSQQKACQQGGCSTYSPNQSFDALQNLINSNANTALTIEGATDVRWANIP